MPPSLLALVARAGRSGANEISRGHRGTVGEWVQESMHFPPSAPCRGRCASSARNASE